MEEDDVKARYSTACELWEKVAPSFLTKVDKLTSANYVHDLASIIGFSRSTVNYLSDSSNPISQKLSTFILDLQQMRGGNVVVNKELLKNSINEISAMFDQERENMGR